MPRLSRPSLLTALLCVSVILNLVLASQVIRLGRAPKGLTTEARLEVGAAAPAIAARTLRGEPVSVGGNDLPLILYVFTPRCVWCARNLDNAKALAAATKGRYNFVALSLEDEGVEDYVARHAIGFTVYRGVSAESRAGYLLGRTPQTIAVSAAGRVEKNWVGAYGPEIESQVEAYFQTTLPGLSPGR
ncbi:MAG TPA: hypothetical protein VK422_05350 [Pyrinomonadaceae bacterium]|nr:hypothetical protein [Pyrinomonadaceae bacterium]